MLCINPRSLLVGGADFCVTLPTTLGYAMIPMLLQFVHPKTPYIINYYICDVNIYGQTFKSAEHAFQWIFCEHANRDELAQEILKSPTPEQAKELASWVPSHLSGTCHEIECETMEQILEAKAQSCPECKQALINS